jgi:serine/threonine protein kinase
MSHDNIVKCYDCFIDVQLQYSSNNPNDPLKDESETNEIPKNQPQQPIKEFKEFNKNENWFLCLSFELCENGNLKNLIDSQNKISEFNSKNNKKKKDIYDEKDLLVWLFHITSGICYMHSKKFIHRDLKPENIFLTSFFFFFFIFFLFFFLFFRERNC